MDEETTHQENSRNTRSEPLRKASHYLASFEMTMNLKSNAQLDDVIHGVQYYEHSLEGSIAKIMNVHP